MLSELQSLIDSKDLIVLTSMDESAVYWISEQYTPDSDIYVVKDAHSLNSEQVLDTCKEKLAEDKKVILVAQFRSQLPIINIASLCNSTRKKLINIELTGWIPEKQEPSSYSYF